MQLRNVDPFLNALLQSRWQFAREDGRVFTSDMRLRRDGRIGNYEHPNEHGWRITDGILEFVRSNGTVTTRFEEVEPLPSGSLRLRGRIAGAGLEVTGYHILEQREVGACGRPLQQNSRCAVLIRTHVVNDKLYHLLDCLQDSVLFDLYVLADESQGELAVGGMQVVPHSIGMCASLGFNTRPANHANAFWLCGDYALYCAEHIIPQYDYYIMIEFDVHFVRQNSLFLEGIINRLGGRDRGPDLDFVGAVVRTAAPMWPLGQPARARYSTVYYSGIFSFVVVSKPALAFLREARLAEGADPRAEGAMIHCEAFALTALKDAGNFRCSSLASLVPGCIGKSYHPGRPDLSEPNYLLGTATDPDPRIELMHPVLDAEEYLTKLWRRGRETTDGIKHFIAHVNALDPLAVAQGLKARFIAEALGAANPPLDVVVVDRPA